MLKSKVGYSTNPDSFLMGFESIKQSTKDFENVKLNFLFTSEKADIKKVVKGINSETKAPIIGCTSSEGILVPDGYITGEDGFTGVLSLNDPNLVVGVAAHESGKDNRKIGRKVAIEAVENANTTRAPAYFFMVASKDEEEEFLMGIQDVIGRVPMFGGTAADDEINENWKIICNDKCFTSGVAVAFFYTDNEIVTSFSGCYKETNNMGLITEVKNDHILVSIDGVSALKKYAHWINESPLDLKDRDLLKKSITKPLGIKDPLGNITVIRHPMFGNDMGTRTTSDDTITLSNKIVEKTAIIQLEANTDQLIEGVTTTLRDAKKKLYRVPAAYILIHCAARKMAIGERIDEVHKRVLRETRGVPFIMPFTFAQYGYSTHSANICGGLMLSFTIFGKN